MPTRLNGLNLSVSPMPEHLAADNLATSIPVLHWWLALFSESLSMLANPEEPNGLRYLALPTKRDRLAGGLHKLSGGLGPGSRKPQQIAQGLAQGLPPQDPLEFPQENRYAWPAVYLPVYANSTGYSPDDRGHAAILGLLYHINQHLSWNQTHEQRVAKIRRLGGVIIEPLSGSTVSSLLEFTPTTKHRTPMRAKRHTKGPRDYTASVDNLLDKNRKAKDILLVQGILEERTPLDSRILSRKRIPIPPPIRHTSELQAAGFTEDEIRQHVGAASVLEEHTDPLPPLAMLPGMVPYPPISDPMFNVPKSIR